MLSLLNFLLHAVLVSSHEEQALVEVKTEGKVVGCSLVSVVCQLLQASGKLSSELIRKCSDAISNKFSALRDCKVATPAFRPGSEKGNEMRPSQAPSAAVTELSISKFYP